jgi:hypothetical protein
VDSEGQVHEVSNGTRTLFGVGLEVIHVLFRHRICLHFVHVLETLWEGKCKCDRLIWWKNFKAAQHSGCGMVYCWLILARFTVRIGSKREGFEKRVVCLQKRRQLKAVDKADVC